MKFVIMLTIFCLASSAHARDPDAPHYYDYGERQTVGGSKWSDGDTFLAIALPVAVILTLALPHVFDGKYERWPVWKFREPLRIVSQGRRWGQLSSPRRFLFPTRSLCGSY